jgi:hypothetical protein
MHVQGSGFEIARRHRHRLAGPFLLLTLIVACFTAAAMVAGRLSF